MRTYSLLLSIRLDDRSGEAATLGVNMIVAGVASILRNDGLRAITVDTTPSLKIVPSTRSRIGKLVNHRLLVIVLRKGRMRRGNHFERMALVVGSMVIYRLTRNVR